MTQYDYEELKAEVKKTMMSELFKTKKRLVNYEKAIYDYAFDRAYALGMQEKNLPDEGTDCTPVEADVPSYIPSTKPDVPNSEPKPSIPKFKHKLGDKVRIVNDWSHGYKHNGEVTEIVAIDESDPEVPYKVDIYDEEEGGGLWYSQSDLESYIEPELILSNSGKLESQEADNESNSKYRNLSQETANRNNRPNNTLTDTQNADTDHFVIKHEMVDNRLQVASMAMAGLLANPTVNDYTSLQDAAHIDFIVEDAVTYADALIAKCEEGDSREA